MTSSLVAAVIALSFLHGAAQAGEAVGWYTAPPQAASARSYWIAGPQGLVILGTQLVMPQTEAMLREAELRAGRKALMAVVLAPLPEQFGGTALLQKHGIKVYTSQQIAAAIPAAHARVLAHLSRQLGRDYPVAEPKPASFGDNERQMLIGGVQFKLRPMGPGCASAHLVVEYDGQLFAGDLVGGPVHPVLAGGSLDAWFQRLRELRALKPRKVFPASGEPGGMALIANQMIYIKQVMDFVTEENPRGAVAPEAIARVKEKLIAGYPAYAAPERLDALIATEWQRQAGATDAQR
jgi:glyoxylase-like metal-dependent hydrolase (beta-lactamase superfamily II)